MLASGSVHVTAIYQITESLSKSSRNRSRTHFDFTAYHRNIPRCIRFMIVSLMQVRSAAAMLLGPSSLPADHFHANARGCYDCYWIWLSDFLVCSTIRGGFYF
eukprot:scaffold27078_cov77-Skeletonema_dohrnii-CCMP3373.AAC.2